jgi:hypothetical protein
LAWPVQPSEGAFNNPALRQHNEALDRVISTSTYEPRRLMHAKNRWG